MDNSVSIDSLLKKNQQVIMKTPDQIVARNDIYAPVNSQPVASTNQDPPQQDHVTKLKKGLSSTMNKALFILIISLTTFIINLKGVRAQISKYVRSPLALTSILTLIVAAVSVLAMFFLWH